MVLRPPHPGHCHSWQPVSSRVMVAGSTISHHGQTLPIIGPSFRLLIAQVGFFAMLPPTWHGYPAGGIGCGVDTLQGRLCRLGLASGWSSINAAAAINP